MTLGTALAQGTALLDRGGIGVPRLTAEVLLAHALCRDRSFLYAHPEHVLTELEWVHYGRYLHERLQRKPTQHITRVQEFYGRDFFVSSDVLIPRPETEHVVEAALPLAVLLKQSSASSILDIGTGSGILAITLALETGRPVIAIDISPAALAVARRNARVLDAKVALVLSDGLFAVADRSVDLIVCNPPYIALSDRETLQPEVRGWEPELALFAGADGLNFYRVLIPQALRVLRPGGSLIVELGAGQRDAVSSLFGPEWAEPVALPDLAGIDRVLTVTKLGE